MRLCIVWKVPNNFKCYQTKDAGTKEDSASDEKKEALRGISIKRISTTKISNWEVKYVKVNLH